MPTSFLARSLTVVLLERHCPTPRTTPSYSSDDTVVLLERNRRAPRTTPSYSSGATLTAKSTPSASVLGPNLRDLLMHFFDLYVDNFDHSHSPLICPTAAAFTTWQNRQGRQNHLFYTLRSLELRRYGCGLSLATPTRTAKTGKKQLPLVQPRRERSNMPRERSEPRASRVRACRHGDEAVLVRRTTRTDALPEGDHRVMVAKASTVTATWPQR